MPGRDGTGPMGGGRHDGQRHGSLRRRRSGIWRGARIGPWLAARLRGEGSEDISPQSICRDDVPQKDLLSQQKRTLESRLEIINKQLETL